MSSDDVGVHTSHPPAGRPLLVWDGECEFCRKSVERIRYQVADRIDTAPYQDVADRLPDIPPALFARSVQLIDTDGAVYGGAEAVFRALAQRPGGHAGLTWYRGVPGVAAVSERVYRFVASHRPLLSRLTRWFVGPDLLPRQFRLTRWLYLRLLGLTVLFAFASMLVQMDALFLGDGISPAVDWMHAAGRYADDRGWGAFRRFYEVPTLAWISSSDGFLVGLAITGVGAAVLLILDVAPAPMLALAWLLYLSLAHVGGIFFHYQWDALLLETLFASILIAPWRPWPGLRGDAEPALAGVWIVRLLLFKVMFLSGAVKLTAHDDTWRSLWALDVHFFTQPIPTWTAYYAHHMPHWLLAAALVVMFVIELVLPWFVFGPRRLRMAFGLGTMVLMLMIGLTGNYGFFNLLTFALALWCFDDMALRRLVPRRWSGRAPVPTEPPERRQPRVLRRAVVVVAVVILSLSAVHSYRRLDGRSEFGQWLIRLTRQFMSVNGYGLFQDMTRVRPEIIVEGSRDGVTWEGYEFRYKPGALDRRPGFTGPHMPRLDWQMWFAALYGCDSAPWFRAFEERLLEGSPAVRAQLARDPFGAEPPRYLRTTVYDYTFTNPGERDWWRRTDPRPFCPPVERR